MGLNLCKFVGLRTLGSLLFLVFHLMTTYSQVQQDAQDTGPSTNFCCRKLDFSGGWCKKGTCFGDDCTTDSGAKCPQLNDCICSGLVKYKTKSTCAIVKACNEAADDYSKAQRRVLELTGQAMTSISGCESAILGVICAYHFPRCEDDIIEYEEVCFSTCLHMYDTCVPEGSPPCPSGSNWTELDSRGEPFRDKYGNIITTPCPVENRRSRTGQWQPGGVVEAVLDLLFRTPLQNATELSQEQTRGMVKGRYYEHEPGKIKLSDFGAVGDRCRRCLTADEISSGLECTTTSQQFATANMDCTAGAGKQGFPLAMLSLPILLISLASLFWSPFEV